nr:nuclear transport factor 2 family protein [Shewanella dokdonensis]
MEIAVAQHPVEQQIAQADKAIMAEDFDTLMQFYAADALLVVKPGMNAIGKAQIRKAFEAIAGYFEHSLQVTQAGMVLLPAGDTVLALARTMVSANNLPATERQATYVFRLIDGQWLCVIDNSYGHALLTATA